MKIASLIFLSSLALAHQPTENLLHVKHNHSKVKKEKFWVISKLVGTLGVSAGSFLTAYSKAMKKNYIFAGICSAFGGLAAYQASNYKEKLDYWVKLEKKYSTELFHLIQESYILLTREEEISSMYSAR